MTRASSPPQFDVLYDGGCGLCNRTVAVLTRLDWLGRLRFVDINAHWDRLEAMFPGVKRDACVDEMHVVSLPGRVTAGFEGFRTLAWQLPLLMLIAPVLHVPGVPLVGRLIYRYVATHRSTSCATGARKAG
jgi:predicted DCC family thiol-disulfide oxidoreductase YuxK